MSAFALFTIARGLALLPAFQHDDEQHKALQRHSEWILLRRPGPRFRARKISPSKIKLYRDFLHQRASKGGLARKLKLNRKQRRDIARNAVLARRWRPVRARGAAGVD
jgi:hypothetical protein